MSRDRFEDHWLIVFVRYLAPVLAVAIAGWAVLIESPSLRDIDRKASEANRATAFRLCTRNKVDRAFAQSFSLDEPAELRKMQRVDGLPVLDCEPNLHGRGARPLSPRQQTEFVRRWKAGTLPSVELGICPESTIGQTVESDSC